MLYENFGPQFKFLERQLRDLELVHNDAIASDMSRHIHDVYLLGSGNCSGNDNDLGSDPGNHLGTQLDVSNVASQLTSSTRESGHLHLAVPAVAAVAASGTTGVATISGLQACQAATATTATQTRQVPEALATPERAVPSSYPTHAVHALHAAPTNPDSFVLSVDSCTVGAMVIPVQQDRLTELLHVSAARGHAERADQLAESTAREVREQREQRERSDERARQVCHMLLQYRLLGNSGHQSSIPVSVVKYLEREFELECECFSSPLSHVLPRWYSLFESDRTFGSLGNFLRTKNETFTSGTFLCMPPCLDCIVGKTYKKISKLLTIAKLARMNMRFFVLTPENQSNAHYQSLKNCPYTTYNQKIRSNEVEWQHDTFTSEKQLYLVGFSQTLFCLETGTFAAKSYQDILMHWIA